MSYNFLYDKNATLRSLTVLSFYSIVDGQIRDPWLIWLRSVDLRLWRIGSFIRIPKAKTVFKIWNKDPANQSRTTTTRRIPHEAKIFMENGDCFSHLLLLLLILFPAVHLVVDAIYWRRARHSEKYLTSWQGSPFALGIFLFSSHPLG